MLFSGLVKDLKSVKIAQIALGKAHAIALSVKGYVYSFGINNKGQCGRDICTPQVNKNSKFYFFFLFLSLTNFHDINYSIFIDYSETANIEAENPMSSVNKQGVYNEYCDENKPNEDICNPGKHNWKHDACMVCTVCGECTGYSISCLSSIRSNRKTGE